MVVHFESVLRMGFIVNYLMLAMGVDERVPALDVAMTVGHLVALLRVLMVAAGVAELVAFGSVQPLQMVMMVVSGQVRN